MKTGHVVASDSILADENNTMMMKAVSIIAKIMKKKIVTFNYIFLLLFIYLRYSLIGCVRESMFKRRASV